MSSKAGAARTAVKVEKQKAEAKPSFRSASYKNLRNTNHAVVGTLTVGGEDGEEGDGAAAVGAFCNFVLYSVTNRVREARHV
jgi:hypothetical protein